MHRDAAAVQPACICFKQLSTLDQQFTHTLLLRSGFGGIEPMLPARTAATAPALRRCAVQYSHRRACGTSYYLDIC